MGLRKINIQYKTGQTAISYLYTNNNIRETQPVSSAKFRHFPITSCSREKRYQALHGFSILHASIDTINGLGWETLQFSAGAAVLWAGPHTSTSSHARARSNA